MTFFQLELNKKLNFPLIVQDSTQPLIEEIRKLKLQNLLFDQIIKKCINCGRFELKDENNSLKQYFFCKGTENGCSKNGTVWGSLNYTSDSDLCQAAVHSGAIGRKIGGFCLVQDKPGMLHYVGSFQNEVRTLDYGKYGGSICFIK